MNEIVFIAPYENLYKIAKNIIEKNNYTNIDIFVGDLKRGLEISRKAVAEGANIIISRGGTYKLLKKEINIPVIELQVSAYDIMNSIRLVINLKAPTAIIGFNNIIYGYDLICDLPGIDIRKIDIKNKEDIASKIQECAKEGIKTFIGDTVVNTICKKMGYRCFMIESSADSVNLTFEKARDILTASKKELERTKRLETLIDYVHDGIIATDENNRILAFNSIAEEIFCISKNDTIGRNLNEISKIYNIKNELINNATVIDEIKKINDTKVNFSKVPIDVNGKNKGAVAIFQEVTKLQNLEKKVRRNLLGDGFTAKYTFDSIIHKSHAIQRNIDVAKKYSKYDSSILIEGNSGVGKELFAQSIHNESKRHSGPFVAVNCAALPPSLIESELFGYVEGAFTGSKKGVKAGLFELAHKGTIFLDEISELPLEVQGRLLRVIQEREVMRLGDSRVIPLDIRIISATNRNLKDMVEKNCFRQDLLYRINTLSLKILPLCERTEDIQPLAEFFADKYCKKYDKVINGFTNNALKFLKSNKFPGNVRELQGMIEKSVIICEENYIDYQDLNEGYIYEQYKPELLETKEIKEYYDQNLSLKEVENIYIKSVYDRVGKSPTKACNILKIDRSTLWRKIKELNK